MSTEFVTEINLWLLVDPFHFTKLIFAYSKTLARDYVKAYKVNLLQKKSNIHVHLKTRNYSEYMYIYIYIYIYVSYIFQLQYTI